MTYKSKFAALALVASTAFATGAFAGGPYTPESTGEDNIAAAFSLKTGYVWSQPRFSSHGKRSSSLWGLRGTLDVNVVGGSLEGMHFEASAMGATNFGKNNAWAADVSAATGYDFGSMLMDSGDFMFRPLVGYMYNHQRAAKRGGSARQTANWYGPFVGLDVGGKFYDEHSLRVRGEFHFLTSTSGKGIQNSSGKHYGFGVGATYGYMIDESWTVTVDGKYDYRKGHKDERFQGAQAMVGVTLNF